MSSVFKPRPIRFLEQFACNDWRIKTYSISYDSSGISDSVVRTIKSNMISWLANADVYNLPTYKIATLIIHKWVGGHFAIINWWIDENMLQVLVFLATNEAPSTFRLYSDKGMMTCVWEMEILWFERNSWVEEVLQKQITETNIKKYLETTLNKY